MLNKTATIVFFVLISFSAFASPKGKESVSVEVVTSNTRIHSSFSRNAFAYTDLMFTQLNGKKVVYQCIQHGNICPMMESGKTYTADREGNFIYISMDTPDDKKAVSVKFRQVGNW
jgi:hypothetical protein